MCFLLKLIMCKHIYLPQNSQLVPINHKMCHTPPTPSLYPLIIFCGEAWHHIKRKSDRRQIYIGNIYVKSGTQTLNQRTEGTDRKVKLFCGKTLPLSEWWKNQTVLKIRSHLSLDFNCPICYTLQPHFDDFNNEGGVVYDIYWQWQCKGDHNTLQYMSNKMFLLWIGLRSDAE